MDAGKPSFLDKVPDNKPRTVQIVMTVPISERTDILSLMENIDLPNNYFLRVGSFMTQGKRDYKQRKLDSSTTF